MILRSQSEVFDSWGSFFICVLFDMESKNLHRLHASGTERNNIPTKLACVAYRAISHSYVCFSGCGLQVYGANRVILLVQTIETLLSRFSCTFCTIKHVLTHFDQTRYVSPIILQNLNHLATQTSKHMALRLTV